MHYKPLNKERIALAHQIIDGIPEEVIDLETYVKKKGRSIGCGTVACGAGWLAMHPAFNEVGLIIHDEVGLIIHASENGTQYPVFLEKNGIVIDDSETALRYVFGGEPFKASGLLFASRGYGILDEEIFEEFGVGISDKKLLLQRMKLTYYGI